MVFAITAYKNTGFNSVNLPSSPAVLNNATSVQFSSNWLFQDQGNTRTRIAATWEQAKDIDYLKIGDTYYFVIGVTMEAEPTATLILQCDYYTTLGGYPSITIQSGWATRAHTTDDTLFSNTIPEPWTPSQNLIIDGSQILFQASDAQLVICGSTIDLSDTEAVAKEYYDTAGDVVVNVPQTTVVKDGSTCIMNLPVQGTKSNVLPNQALYAFRNANVQKGVQAARSLGVDNAITSCYAIPYNYYSDAGTEIDVNSGLISTITGVRTSVTPTGLSFNYGGATNNKVYSMYNSYTILSICSGDRLSFEGYEIYNNANNPTFNIYSDPSPGGSPYIAPTTYLGTTNQPFQNAVKGIEWQNTPFLFQPKSGDLIDGIRNLQSIGRDASNLSINAVKGVTSLVGGSVTEVVNPFNLINNAINSGQSLANEALDLRQKYTDFQVERNIRVPEVFFPRDESIQNYIGNAFYCYRVRLSASDVQRFDRFLTYFGYAQDRPLTLGDFSSRQYFNYVKGEDVVIGHATQSLRMRQACAQQIENGARFWHVLPTTITSNPIRT